MLRTKLPGVLQELDNVPNINAGGCGIVALLLYQQLLEYSPRILYVHDVELSAGRAGAYHVVLVIGTGYYDSTGRYTKKQLHTRYEGCDFTTVSFERLRASVNCTSLWNNYFNRKYIPTVIDIVNKLHKE